MPTQKVRTSKSVRWSTITVYEFGVGLGGSAVPKHGGPAIGLAKTPKHVWKTTVDAARRALACECRLEGDKTKSGGAEPSPEPPTTKKSAHRTTCSCSCGRRRRRRVRWFKPLERVSMLEHAGYSEKRIYRMLMESSDIAMSRRLTQRLVAESNKKQRR